jgi:hypothetical protein
MATYKVLQDIEAEDKLIGPLTLWQFIYALAAGLCIYLSVIAVLKNVPFFLVILVPIALITLFLAIPWGGDQPLEVWALAKLRFYLKPRKRIWSQDGMTELVAITAPKRVERVLTDGLTQHEVNSRLSALASTLDSRGWVVKNVNVNLFAAPTAAAYIPSDRLVDVSGQPQEVSNLDIRADDDILDETANPVAQNFSTLINTAATEYRNTLLARMRGVPGPSGLQPVGQMPISQPIPQAQPTVPVQDTPWFVPPTAQANPMTNPFMAPAVQAAEPTDAEESIIEKAIEDNARGQAASQSHLKTLKTPEQLADEARNAIASAAANQASAQAKASMTAEKQAAIINLAQSNDLNIATLQRQADRTLGDEDTNEVVIPLR